MKQPNLSHLKIDRGDTKKIRTALTKKNRVTITVNLDTESLMAATIEEEWNPLPATLEYCAQSNLPQQESIQSRLDRLEQELRKIKRHVAA